MNEVTHQQQAMMHCLRCPCEIDSRQCVHNRAVMANTRIQGYLCKRQRFEHNRVAQGDIFHGE